MSTVVDNPVATPKVTVESALEIAMQLSKDDREVVASRLYDSLHDDLPTSEEWNREWAAELNRRIADIESGKVKTIPGEVVHAEIRKKLGMS